MAIEKDLIGIGDAAELARVNPRTIQEWERKGWLTVAVKLAPRATGRPGKLYRAEEVRKVAIERGRDVALVTGQKKDKAKKAK